MMCLQHSLYGVGTEQYELFLNYIKKYTAVRIQHLLIPLVRDDHWHLVLVDLKEKVVNHYSSASHEAWMEPVNKIINYFDEHQVDFKDKVVKHYSSAEHEAWMEPVNKIINFFDAHHADFIEDIVRKIFRFQAINCEQQRGRLVPMSILFKFVL